ncbi:MAG: hypothetical protein ACYDCO_26895 [Armatimonadota bacterium]
MDCPQCGYVMAPFEAKCPRCARLGGKAAQSSPEPEEQSEPPAARMKTAAKDTASQFQAVPLIKLPKMQVDEPELGWTLTISLWIVIGLNGLLSIILLAMGLLTSGGSILLAMLAAFGPGVRLVGALGILRCQRWGFWVFAVFAVIPVCWMLLFNGVAWLFTDIKGWLELCLNVLPSLLIFFLSLAKWGEFE